MAQEKNFENKIKQYLSEQGCYTIKYHGDRFSVIGVPDLLVCCNGYFLGLEIKAPNGKPNELQLVNLRDLTNAGGYGAIVVPTVGVDKIKDYINKNYPKYAGTNVIDFNLLKKVIENYKKVIDNYF